MKNLKRSWETRCWVDGHSSAHIVEWSSKEEAIEQCKIAMAGTPFVAACKVVRLEVVEVDILHGVFREAVSHRWNGNREGTFEHQNFEGKEMLPSSMPPVEIQ